MGAAAGVSVSLVDGVLDWTLSVDGFLVDGELVLLLELSGLLDLEGEGVSQGTLHVDGPFWSVLLSADGLELTLPVLGLEGGFQPFLVLSRNVDLLFLAGGAGGTRRVLLVALAAR